MKDQPLFYKVTSITHKGEKVYSQQNQELLSALYENNEYDARANCTANLKFNCPVYERKWYKFWIFPLRNPKRKELLIEKIL